MNKIEIYIRSTCPYCMRSKRILDKLDLAYTEYEITGDPARREEMIDRSQRTTVPQIFINDRSIGGSDELVELVKNGKIIEYFNGDGIRKKSSQDDVKYVA